MQTFCGTSNSTCSHQLDCAVDQPGCCSDLQRLARMEVLRLHILTPVVHLYHHRDSVKQITLCSILRILLPSKGMNDRASTRNNAHP